MANIKISELQELFTVAESDVLPIVDADTNETKKVNSINLQKKSFDKISELKDELYAKNKEINADIANLQELISTLTKSIDEIQTKHAGTIVYDNEAGSNELELTLTENVSNAEYIEIYYGRRGDIFASSSKKVPKKTIDNSFNARLDLVYGYRNENIVLVCAQAEIKENKLTYTDGRSVFKDIVDANILTTTGMDLAIFKIIAYYN